MLCHFPYSLSRGNGKGRGKGGKGRVYAAHSYSVCFVPACFCIWGHEMFMPSLCEQTVSIRVASTSPFRGLAPSVYGKVKDREKGQRIEKAKGHVVGVPVIHTPPQS